MTDQADNRTSPESDYSRQTVRRRGMRTGYTTGSTAAAATKAAALTLLTGSETHEVTIPLPVGRNADFSVHWTKTSADGSSVTCAVLKDGGDDPDVTTGRRYAPRSPCNP